MKLIKEYLCSNRTPSDEELKEAIEIVEKEKCVVRIIWYYPYNGWHNLYIKDSMTLEECKAQLPKVYPV